MIASAGRSEARVTGRLTRPVKKSSGERASITAPRRIARAAAAQDLCDSGARINSVGIRCQVNVVSGGCASINCSQRFETIRPPTCRTRRQGECRHAAVAGRKLRPRRPRCHVRQERTADAIGQTLGGQGMLPSDRSPAMTKCSTCGDGPMVSCSGRPLRKVLRPGPGDTGIVALRTARETCSSRAPARRPRDPRRGRRSRTRSDREHRIRSRQDRRTNACSRQRF